MTGKFRRGRRPAIIMTAAAVAAAALATAVVPSVQAAPAATACPAEVGVGGKDVKIAIINAQSGPGSSTAEGFRDSIKLRIDQENARGGVNGRKIIATFYDDQTTPQGQVAAFNKAMQQDGNFGVINFSPLNSMYPLAKAGSIPVVTAGKTETGTDRNVFGANGASSLDIGTTAEALRVKQAGGSKTALLGSNTPNQVANLLRWSAAFPAIGLSIGTKIGDMPLTAFDATSTALKIKDSGSDSVLMTSTLDAQIAVAKALAQQGLKPKATLMSALSDPATVPQLNGSLEAINAIGFNVTTIPMTVPRPNIKILVSALKRAGINPYAGASGNGYVMADLMIRGLKEAGTCLTRANFINKLRNVANYDGGGLLPELVSFRPGLTPNGNPTKCIWFQSAKNGTLVADAKATCGQFVDAKTGKIIAG